MSEPLTVLGLGNPLMGDDGAGVRVVELLRARRLPPGVAVVDGGVGGLDFYDLLAEAGREVWVVDALRRAADAPGTLHVIDDCAGRLSTDGALVSGHDVTVAHALRLARALGDGPARVRLYGIVPDRVGTGGGLSPAVEAAARRAADEIATAAWDRAGGGVEAATDTEATR